MNFIIFVMGVFLFAQSAEYTAFLTKAKQFESQKKWCHALDSYYDAMGTDDEPEVKNAILNGNPGFGKFNPFTLHDDWKNLLIDAEQVGCSFSRYELTLGNLIQGDLDYTTKTASYKAKISYKDSDRYLNTVRIVENGYKVAYRDDWSADLPKEWPLFSVSSKKDKNYNVNGAFVFERFMIRDRGERLWYYMNPFAYNQNLWMYKTAGLFDYKFNIVDENGKELVKGNRWLLMQDDFAIIKGISPEVMDLIDNGKAFINPVACYLEYGAYNTTDDNGGRSFVKNLPEVQLSMEKSVFICWNNKSDKIADNVKKNKLKFNEFNFVEVPGSQYKMLQTEITQKQYELVMNENPSYQKGEKNPVENVSWYDAIYFCNKLSEMKEKRPVYAVDGETDVTKWGYKPHEFEAIKGEITQSTNASGYRLPTLEEWQYAAKGGEDYDYAGSDNLDEVGWYSDNSDHKTHPVAQKKANAYGLYDMSGNVWEWVWDSSYYDDNYRYNCGGSYYVDSINCKFGLFVTPASYGLNGIGFRVVCPSSILE